MSLYSYITFSARDIGKTIQNLESNKARGHANLSIRMLKTCGDSIVYRWRWLIRKLFLLARFLLNVKKEIFFPFTKRATNKILKTIDQFLYFEFVVKYLKDIFLMKCLSIFLLLNSYLEPSLVSNLGIPASTNCYQLTKKFWHLLIMD